VVARTVTISKSDAVVIARRELIPYKIALRTFQRPRQEFVAGAERHARDRPAVATATTMTLVADPRPSRRPGRGCRCRQSHATRNHRLHEITVPAERPAGVSCAFRGVRQMAVITNSTGRFRAAAALLAALPGSSIYLLRNFHDFLRPGPVPACRCLIRLVLIDRRIRTRHLSPSGPSATQQSTSQTASGSVLPLGAIRLVPDPAPATAASPVASVQPDKHGAAEQMERPSRRAPLPPRGGGFYGSLFGLFRTDEGRNLRTAPQRIGWTPSTVTVHPNDGRHLDGDCLTFSGGRDGWRRSSTSQPGTPYRRRVGMVDLLNCGRCERSLESERPQCFAAADYADDTGCRSREHQSGVLPDGPAGQVLHGR
jgi:hypothetical protein